MMPRNPARQDLHQLVLYPELADQIEAAGRSADKHLELHLVDLAYDDPYALMEVVLFASAQCVTLVSLPARPE